MIINKRMPGNIALLMLSVVSFFALFELFLAFFLPHKITVHPAHQVDSGQYHSIMGWVNKPNLDETVRNREISFRRRHNSKGLRSVREISREKPAGVKRILLLGHSFFWGDTVDDEDIISEALQRKVGKGMEIINGAVIGYGTDQELLWLIEEGLKYNPDLIVLGFYSGNDFDEIATSICYGYPKPIFDLDNGKLALGNVPVPDTRETRRKAFNEPDTLWGKAKKYLRHRTHTYPFLARELNSVPNLRNIFIKTGLAEENTRSLPGVPYYSVESWKKRELSEALIKSMRDIARQEAGADFLLVWIPEAEIDPENRVAYEGDYNWDEIYRENSEHESYFREVTTRGKLHFLNLLPRIREDHLKGIRLYNTYEYDHHWSAAGHEMAAEAIFKYLQETGWVEIINGENNDS